MLCGDIKKAALSNRVAKKVKTNKVPVVVDVMRHSVVPVCVARGCRNWFGSKQTVNMPRAKASLDSSE